MMKYSFYILFTLLLSTLSQAQILDEYPKNQDFYEGGLEAFYRDAHDYLLRSNAKKCDDNEIFQPRIIITSDLNVKMVFDGDKENIEKNKCAYDLSLDILKNLKKWKAAEVKGNTYGAITEFIIYPKDLMANYKKGYVAEKLVIGAQYFNGNKAFKKDFDSNFEALFSDYHINGSVNLEFYISKNGDIVNARIYPQINNSDFNKDFMRALGRLKKSWKPALYSNIPIKQRIAFPVSFSITFTEQRTR